MKYDVVELTYDYTDVMAWDIPPGQHQVKFADKTVKMTREKLIYSRFYWHLHRVVGSRSIPSTHALLGDYRADTHIKLGAVVFMGVFNSLPQPPKPGVIWELSREFLEIGSAICNMVSAQLGAYVTSACLYDAVAILEDPRVKEAKESYRAAVPDKNYSLPQSAIKEEMEKVYSVVRHVLYSDDAGNLLGNGIRKLCRTGQVSQGQMLQLIGPRGFVPDVDGWVFQYPIDNGYLEGLDKLVDAAMESRSSSRSLLMQDDPLQQSEYFNRRMQLLCSVIHSVVGDSCTGYVTDNYYVNEGESEMLKGSYHMVDGQPVMIWDDHADLVGQFIQLRTISGCNNEDPQTVCKTCLGWTHNVIPPGTNVGHAICTILCAIITQLLLSNKHFEGSALAATLDMTALANKWLRKDKNNTSILYLRREMKSRKPVLMVPVDYARQINQILSVDVDQLPVSRITSCPMAFLHTRDRQGNIQHPGDQIDLSVAGAGSYLSMDTLEYMKAHGWEQNGKFIQVNLERWDYSKPLFMTPRTSDNVHLFLKIIKNFIMPPKNIGILAHRSRVQALNEFTDLLSKRLKFNIVCAQIFIRACMLKIDEHGETTYDLPRAADDFVYGSASSILLNRTLAGMLAYQEQSRCMSNPDWYLRKDRPVHPLDWVLAH